MILANVSKFDKIRRQLFDERACLCLVELMVKGKPSAMRPFCIEGIANMAILADARPDLLGATPEILKFIAAGNLSAQLAGLNALRRVSGHTKCHFKMSNQGVLEAVEKILLSHFHTTQHKSFAIQVLLAQGVAPAHAFPSCQRTERYRRRETPPPPVPQWPRAPTVHHRLGNGPHSPGGARPLPRPRVPSRGPRGRPCASEAPGARRRRPPPQTLSELCRTRVCHPRVLDCNGGQAWARAPPSCSAPRPTMNLPPLPQRRAPRRALRCRGSARRRFHVESG